MKVVLIYPRADYNIDFVGNDGYVRNMSGYPPLSLAYVAAIIKKAGHQAAIIDGNINNLDLNSVVKQIKKEQPDLLGFTVTFPTFHSVLFWIRELKRITGLPVLIGGSFTELYPLEFMRHKEIDYLLCGSGVSTIAKFLDSFSKNNTEGLSGIPGLCFRRGGEIVVNEIVSNREDINELPHPARELLPNHKYFAPFSSRKNFTPFLASRGCFYKCVYCCLPGKLQLRDPDDIMAELEDCYHRFDIRSVDFYDSIFTIDKSRSLELCRRFRQKGLKINWSIRTHVNFVDEELLRELSASGCRMVMYGIESVDPGILKNLKRPAAGLEKIIETVRLTRKSGMSAFGFFMFGSPGESEATIKSSMDASKKIGLDFAQFTRVIPIPGTELYQEYQRLYDYDYWRQVVIDNCPQRELSCVNAGLKTEEIIGYARKAGFNFYFRPRQIFKIILSVNTLAQFRNYARSGFNMALSYFMKRKSVFGIGLIVLLINLWLNALPGYAQTQARTYLREGRFNEAIQSANGSLAKNPDDYQPYYDLGAIYNAMGKYDDSLKYYKEASKRNPADSLIYSDIGNTYGDMGKYEESLKWYRKAIEINPRVCDYYTYIGEVYENFGRYKEAIRWYNKAIEVDKNDSDSYYDIGRIYCDLGDYQEALKWHKKAIEVKPGNTKAYSGLGAVYEALGDYDQAEKYYREAVRINPKEFRSYFGLGNISRRKGKLAEAERWYKESIKKSTQQRFILCPYEGLGLTYIRLGKKQEAQESFLAMVKLRPYDSLGYYNLSRYYHQIGDYGLALANVDKALSLAANPSDRRQYLQLKGFILILKEDYPSAEKVFNNLDKEFGANCYTLAGLGHIISAKKDYKLARRYFDDALKQPEIVSSDKNPTEDKTVAYLGLARLDVSQGNYKEAINYYQMILKVEPIAVFALAGLGDVYTKLGEKAKADIYYKRAQAINPEAKI